SRWICTWGGLSDAAVVMWLYVNTILGSVLLVFFFQAEDGIRDPLVTGVQTCALPISHGGRARRAPGPPVRARSGGTRDRAAGGRSEERRVGKECRSRRDAEH